MVEKTLLEMKMELVGVKDKIRELEGRQRRLVDEIIKYEWGVKVGDIVVDRKGNLYKVTSLKSWGSSKPWVEGNILKKEGGFSKAKRHLYGDWERSSGGIE